jgi:hypothetical protein
MCLSIGAPSVSIWKNAISNRKRTCGIDVCHIGSGAG